MIVVMKAGASDKDVAEVTRRIETAGLKPHLSQGVQHTIIGVIGQIFPELKETLETMHGVDEVIPVSKPYKLASREFHPRDTIINIGGVAIGGREIVVMAGPCAVESEEQLMATARAVKAAGADGIMVEVHPTPDVALKDGPQSLTFDNFHNLMAQLVPVAAAVGRSLAVTPAGTVK